MNGLQRLLIGLFAGAMLSWTLVAGAATSPSVPLDSWVYPALERLQGFGWINGGLQGDRPWTRLEAARLTAEALEHRDPAGPAAAGEMLSRLEEEFSAELAELAPAGEGARNYFKALSRARLGYAYRDGKASSYPGTNAAQFPLEYNRRGLVSEEGSNLEAEIAGSARYRLLLASWRPLLQVREGDGIDLRLLDGGVTLALGPVDLFAGRQSLWWGQGRHGSLVLTDNARPLDMLRLTNPLARPLPWIFRYLGPFRFDLFLSRLEADRVVPEPYLGGLRINFKPVPWLEVGASRTTLFGGDGRPHVGWDDFLKILSGVNPSAGENDNADSIAAVDGRLRIPPLAGLELYGEWGGEDEANHFVSKEAWLLGAFLPHLDPAGRWSLRAEFTNLAHDDAGPAWYRHGTYRSGYTYHGLILGHHAGGDSRDLYGELAWWASPDLNLALSLDLEKRGVSGTVEEKHTEPGLDLRYRLAPGLELRGRYRFDRARNLDRIAGNDQDQHFFLVEMVMNMGKGRFEQ